MKTINFDNYNPNMGILISLEKPENFISKKGSINLSATKLLDNPSKYLNKNLKYFFYCENGIQSRRVVQILSVYGYNVVKVIL